MESLFGLYVYLIQLYNQTRKSDTQTFLTLQSLTSEFADFAWK